jgi:tRNA threonylcarbamoyladenosine biosynthesis protein TsaB
MGIDIHDLIGILREKKEDVIFVGDGVYSHKDLLKTELQESCYIAPVDILMQRASTCARLALMKAAKGEIETQDTMLPFYLRESQAEQMYKKKAQG